MKNKFSDHQVESLRTLVGQKLQYVAGPNLSSLLQSDLVIIATDSQCVAFQGDIHEDAFEGFPETYSSIEAFRAEETDIIDSISNGNQYFFKKGEQISGLFVIQDKLVGYLDGKESWEYSTDIGIVLKLESGFLALSRLGYHDEMLQVTYLDELNLEDIPETLGRFDNDLHVNFTSSRSIIKI